MQTFCHGNTKGHSRCSNLLPYKFLKVNAGLVPKSCKYTANDVVWRIGIPQSESGFGPNIQAHRKLCALQEQDTKSAAEFGP